MTSIACLFLILATFLTAILKIQAEIDFTADLENELRTDLTWCLLNPDMPHADELRAEIKKALHFWETYARYRFKEVSAEVVDADIIIHWQDGFFNKDAHEVAYSYYWHNPPRGQVFVDGNEYWSYLYEDDERAIDASIILKHQLGHVLGLQNSLHFALLMRPHYEFVELFNSATFKRIPLDGISERYVKRNICNIKYDAVALFHRERIVFFGKYMYFVVSSTIALIRDYWPQLPTDLRKIDAFYADDDNNNFEIFFIEDKIYRFERFKLATGYPKNLKRLFKNLTLNYVDTVLPYGGEIFVVSGEQYWKFSRNWYFFDGPYNTSLIDGMPPRIDAAFQTKYGVSFIIKEDELVQLPPFPMGRELYFSYKMQHIICLLDCGHCVPPPCCNI